MKSRPSDPRRGQRGVTLIWVAVFLFTMILFIALGVDMAKLMTTRTQLQNAADAAALAGAMAYARNLPAAAAVDSAQAAAIRTASYNNAFRAGPVPVVVLPSDVVVVPTDTTVTVTTRRERSAGTAMTVSFLQVLGSQFKTLDASAKATAKATGGGKCDLWPIAGQPPNTGFTRGCLEYVLKYPAGSGTQGSYGGLDLYDLDPDCNAGGHDHGANTYRYYLNNGYHCCLAKGTCIPSQQGNISGPTRQAIEDRFAADTDQKEGICFTEYHGDTLQGPRIVWVPITSAKGTEGCAGYTIEGYSKFFLTRIPKPNESVIYANYMGYQDAGGTQDQFTVRLIH